MTRKIALILGLDEYVDDTFIVQSITDWVEVSEADYQRLEGSQWDYEVKKRMGFNGMQFRIVEQPVSQPTTIAEALEVIKTVQAERDEAKRKRDEAEAKRQAEAAAKRALKKAEKDKKSEAELLAALIERHPDMAKALAAKASGTDDGSR